MNRKYELVPSDIIEYKGRRLTRIRATRDFGRFVYCGLGIKAGELGGYIESEKNLSQKGDCWIYPNAKAMDNSQVKDNAELLDYAEIYDEAIVCDDARIYDYGEVHDDIKVGGCRHECQRFRYRDRNWRSRSSLNTHTDHIPGYVEIPVPSTYGFECSLADALQKLRRYYDEYPEDEQAAGTIHYLSSFDRYDW